MSSSGSVADGENVDFEKVDVKDVEIGVEADADFEPISVIPEMSGMPNSSGSDVDVENVDVEDVDDVEWKPICIPESRTSQRAGKGTRTLRYYEEHPFGGFEPTHRREVKKRKKKSAPQRNPNIHDPDTFVRLNTVRTRIVRFRRVNYLIPNHFHYVDEPPPPPDPVARGRKEAEAFTCTWKGCRYWTDTEESFKIHEDSIHLSWIGELFKDTLEKAKSEAIRDRGSSFLCVWCRKRFKEDEDCLEHVLTAHRKRFRPVMCIECPFEARHPRQLKHHYKLTHIETPVGNNNSSSSNNNRNPLAGVLKAAKTARRVNVWACDSERCDFVASTDDELRKHKIQVHGDLLSVAERRRGQHCCPTCGKVYLHWEFLRKHEGRAHGDFYCSHKRKGCEFRGSNLEDVKQHVRSVHLPTNIHAKKVQCSQCGKQVASINNHMRLFHGKVMRCDKCGFESTWGAEFERHCLNQHADVCDQCGLPVDRNESRLRPGQSHQCPAVVVTGLPTYQSQDVTKKRTNHGFVELKDKNKACTFCAYTCPLKANIGRHVALMHKTQACPDPTCQAIFNNRPDLVMHLKSYHPGMCINCGVTRLQDHSCEKTLFFGSSPLLLRIPEDYRPVACDMCQFLLPAPVHLRLHIRNNHKNINPNKKVTHKCKSCDFVTEYVNEFEKHLMFVHSEVCNTCGLPIEVVCKGRIGVSRHECPAVIMVESVEIQEEKIKKTCSDHIIMKDLSYVCLMCGFTCFSAITRQRHMTLMHTLQMCPDLSCQASFSNRVELNDHMQMHHPDMCSNCGVWRGPDHSCDRTLFFETSPMMLRLPESLRPLVCSLCQGRMLGLDHLKRHLVQKHDITYAAYSKN